MGKDNRAIIWINNKKFDVILPLLFVTKTNNNKQPGEMNAIDIYSSFL